MWIVGASSGHLSGESLDPESSPTAVAIFGSLSELIQLTTKRTHCSTLITFVHSSLHTGPQTPAERMPPFVSAWAGLLGSDKIVCHLPSCSPSITSTTFFDADLLWRGTVTGHLHMLGYQSASSTTAPKFFNVDDFLDILEASEPKSCGILKGNCSRRNKPPWHVHSIRNNGKPLAS